MILFIYKQGKTNMNNERYRKLTLLHSNDMHGDFLAEDVSNKLVGGVSMLSGYISKVRQEEENVIYCIAGDMFRGSVIDSESKGYSTIEIVNMLSPDIVTLGNHETDYGVAHLLFLEKCARFPIINANLFIKMSGKRLFKPYHIIEVGGMKILFIGIITQDVISETKMDSFVGSLVDINEASKEIEKICNTFKGIDIDFTVILTHIGFENDKLLAAALNPELGVDVIIGGHSHTLLEKPEKVNDVLIVQAGVGTDQIGRFDILVDTDNNSVASYEWQTVPIDANTCPVDPKIEKLVESLKSETDIKYNRVLRRLNTSLHHETRFKQTSLGNFVVDIFQKALKPDLFITTSGSIRVKEIGPIITLLDIVEAYPFEQPIYECKLTGKQIKDLVKFICRDDVFEGKVDGFYQFSKDWYFEYSRKDHKVTKAQFKGEDIKDDQLFTVCMIKYDYFDSAKFFNLEKADIEKNGKVKTVSTSNTQILYEYLDSDEPLPDYPGEERLLVY